jgi:hypothetical protein
MKKSTILFILITFVLVGFSINWAISDSQPTERERRAMVDHRVDNNGYWIKMAEQGLATLNPEITPEPAVFVGSEIKAFSVLTEDSPDVPVTDESAQQSENSIFIDPNNEGIMVNSNNSGPPGFYGADNLYSFDFSETWEGTVQGPGGSNSGDPAVCIGTDGRWYIGYISNGGQGVSYSDNQGQSWTKVQVAPNPGQLADKNHMWIDTKEGSPYENYLYNAWTPFGGSANGKIVVSLSSDNGESWTSPAAISNGTNGFHQGVNLTTGPNGEVYAVWGVTVGGGDEDAIGFAKSYDGGATWETAYKIIDNIRGIRSSGVPQNMRVNSFPVIAADISDGEGSGNLYVTWTNVGTPGQNSGSDRRVYMIKSEDEGDTWSEPIQINQSENDNGYVAYFPWIDVDPSNGVVVAVFYDNRNSGSTSTEAWSAVSYDQGETWEDFKVSDVAFTPAPIAGLADGYMGDYLGIRALNGWVYPTWTDNRTGQAQTYVSPFQTITVMPPTALTAVVDQETGDCDLNWNHPEGSGFQYFNIYRNDEFLISVTNNTYTDPLTEYGYYTYQVTAFYGGDNESAPATKETQYGSSSIVIDPDTYEANVYIGDSVIQYMAVKNVGELELDFSRSPFFKSSSKTYPLAAGGGDEFIRKVSVSNLQNGSGFDGYGNYTSHTVEIESGKSYPITVQAANPFNGDQCGVWIDWNNNGEFDEQVLTLSPDETHTFFTGIISTPSKLKPEAIRMRIRLLGPEEKLTATGDSKYGDVEDYTLKAADWITVTPDEGIVAPGDSLMVELKFKAGELTTGTYNDNIRFITNDLEHPSFKVFFVMNVTDLQVTASATPGEICEGEATKLEAIPTGGTGTYSYAWTSNPAGFESTEQSPIITPDENTEYYLAVNDGIISMYDTTSVIVNSLPEVNLGSDQTFCDVDEYELDAGNPGSEYLWSTGATTQTIMAAGEGETEYWVKVTNTSGCAASDSVMLNFATSPTVNLGADTTICRVSEFTLNAGNPGSEYLWSTGETTQTIVVKGEDYPEGLQEFSCMVTNTDGCESSGSIEVEILDCTSIDELSSVSLEVYPNPNSGIFNLDLGSAKNQTVTIRVMTATGAIVYDSKQNIDGKTSLKIDLQNQADGVYSIFVTGKNTLLNKKIVVSR